MCKKKNQSGLFGADRKISPTGSLFGITRQSVVIPNSDPLDGFFYLHLTLMKDYKNLTVNLKVLIHLKIILR